MRKSIAFLGTVAAAAMLLTACSPSTAGGDDGDVEGKTVCFDTLAESHPYVTPFNEAVKKGADAAGVDLTVLSAEFDLQTGTEQLDQCVSQAPDAIILWPLDPAAYIPGLTRAQQAGIPVILVNASVNEEALKLETSFTGPDNYQQGQLNAQLLADALPDGGNVVVLAGLAGSGTTVDRTDGFVDDLDSKFTILDTVNGDFDKQKALTVSRDILTRFGDQIDAVYAEDDNMAAGFADAYQEAGLTAPIILTGVGGSKEAFALIKDGRMYGTILQSPVEDGTLGWDTTLSILNGETVDARIPLNLPVITSDNIADYDPAF